MAGASGLLLGDESRRVHGALCTGQTEILALTVARLYQASSSDWSYTRKMGAVALTRSSGRFQLQLVDLAMGRVIWDCQLTGDIKYVKDLAHFHSFLGPTSLMGLCFADDREATGFGDAVLGRESIPVSVAASKPAQFPPTSTMRNAETAASASPKVSRTDSIDSVKSTSTAGTGSTGGGFFGFGKKKTKSSKIDKSMISAPENFQHLSHVGYDPKTGFSAQNIPMEWKIIFKKAGITEEQLQDKKTAKVVAKFMKEHGGAATAPAAAVPGPKAPSPGQSRRAPPPPPPSRGSARGPPPPLPASRGSAIPPSAPARPPPPPGPSSVPPAPGPPSFGSASVPPPPPPPPVPAGGMVPSPQPSMGGPPPPPMPGSGPPPPLAPPRVAPVAPPRGAPVPADPRGGLLDSIRSAGGLGGLKKVQRPETPPSMAPDDSRDGGDDLAAALRNALNRRKGAVGGSDSEEEDDEDWDA